MSDDFIGIDIQGLDDITRKLAQWPPQAQDAASQEVSDYLVNVLQTEQPTPNEVSRFAAYGVAFFTDRQRRWFFANLNEGTIEVPYRRTQELRRGWRKLGQGANVIIVNETEGAEFVVGERQSRHEAKVGWKKFTQVLDERAARIEEVAYGAVKKVIRRLGLE